MDYVLIFSAATAFILGAAHALEPGHGKTLVAAYLTGTQGRVKDALFLGLLITVFHTLSSFIIAMTTILVAGQIFQYQEEMLRALQVLSGLIIFGIGCVLFYRRFIRDKVPNECECHVHHVHAPEHTDPQLLIQRLNGEQAAYAAMPTSGSFLQSAGAPTHEVHVGQGLPEVLTGTVPSRRAGSSFKEVFYLGLASGITPCPTSLAILIASVTVGGYGKLPEAILMLVFFSLGLSSVLVLVGITLVLSADRFSNLLIKKDSRLSVFISRVSIFLILGLGVYLVASAIVTPAEDAHYGENIEKLQPFLQRK